MPAEDSRNFQPLIDEINTKYASVWPNITEKRDAPPDAKEFDGMDGKFEKYFSPNPGSGD